MRFAKSGWVLGFLLLAATPAIAAVPFGNLEGLVGGGNAGGGILPISGWALDDDGVERVELFVDGVVAALADFGQNRPDVQLRFPGYPDGGQGGFGVLFDSTPYSNGLHSFSARVTSFAGEQVLLNEIQIQVTNTTHLLYPFGGITFPNASSEMFGNCDLEDPSRRLSVVQGWALDLGVELGDTGVKYVELLINGGLYANTVTDCFFDAELGGFTNCYGLPSLDVEKVYPTIANSPHAGFRFVLDVGVLVNFGFLEGFHELVVRVGDISGQVANVAEIPVIFVCDDAVGNAGGFGFIDRPENGQLTSGTTEVFGWALDAEGVALVQVYLDGALVGNAIYGLAYPGVSTFHPGFPDSAFPGWSFQLDTTATSDGLHHVQAVVVDEVGAYNIIGERYFTVRNE